MYVSFPVSFNDANTDCEDMMQIVVTIMKYLIMLLIDMVKNDMFIVVYNIYSLSINPNNTGKLGFKSLPLHLDIHLYRYLYEKDTDKN